MAFPVYAPVIAVALTISLIVIWVIYRRQQLLRRQAEANPEHNGVFASSGSSPGGPHGGYGASQYPPQSQYPAQYPQQQYSPAQQYGGAPAGGVYNYSQAPPANAGHGAVYGQPVQYSGGAPPSNNNSNLYV